jgi:hypothetical protein
MSGTRNYSQGGYSSNVFGTWGYSDASCSITATSTFTNRAFRGYGKGAYGSNVFGIWAEYDSGPISCSSSSSLSLSAAVPVDTYSSGEYGYGNYSAGTIREASITINAVGSVTAVGGYVASGLPTVNAVATISLLGQVVSGGIIPAQATSSLSVIATVTFSGNPQVIQGVSNVTVTPVRVVFIDVSNISAQSSTNFSARLKWVDEPNATTNWTEVYKVAA